MSARMDRRSFLKAAGGTAAAFVRGPENVLFELIQAK